MTSTHAPAGSTPPQVYTVTMTARQHLSLGTRPTGTAPTRTHRHIPGSVLRGALAAVWIAAHGTPDRLHAGRNPQLYREFTALFEGAVRYEPLFAPGWQVVPMSVRRCKYRSSVQCTAWCADEAFTDPPPARCGVCQGPVENAKGGVEPAMGSTDGLIAQTVRLAINDATATAAEGQLFTREALRPRTADGRSPRTFTGRIVIPNDLPAPARTWLTTPRPVRVGGRRGTSGLTDLALAPEITSPSAVTGHRLALRLTSPALLTDACGLPVTAPSQDEISQFLGTHATIERQWVRYERVGGWHLASNLPKPEELAISAGSTYLLNLADPLDPQRTAALTTRGLGLRRAEGFGACTIADTAWQPPAVADNVDRPATAEDPAENKAQHVARLLLDTGHGPWFHRELRAYLTDRGSGTPPHARMLDKPELDNLTPVHRRRIEAVLLRPDRDVPVLDRAWRLLDAYLRGLGPHHAATGKGNQ
jgi:CRISPR-associated protein Csx10